jgi:hypothetical protein
MTGNSVTQALERGIFERFAKAARLDVEHSSITQPDPPDILCNIAGVGLVGFELTAVDDAAALTRMSLLARTHEFWSQALDSFDPTTRARLRTEHGGVPGCPRVCRARHQRPATRRHEGSLGTPRREARGLCGTPIQSVRPDGKGRLAGRGTRGARSVQNASPRI